MDYANQRAEDRFKFEIASVQAEIVRRMGEYEMVLRNGAAFFDASDEVTRSDWRNFYNTLQLEQYYPGILGFGFSRWLLPAELSGFIADVRAEGYPEFTVFPSTQSAESSAIEYIEPFNARNQRAFGFNMWSEPVRRTAMQRARDTGLPALTGRVTLIQENTQENSQAIQPGVLMYFPVYRHGQSLVTLEQRRAALMGFVFSPFRMYDLMKGILDQMQFHVAFEVLDRSGSTEPSLLYSSEFAGQTLPQEYQARFFQETHVTVAGQPWTLRFRSLPSFDAKTSSTLSSFVALAGLLIDALLFVVILQLVQLKRRDAELASEMSRQLVDTEQRFEVAVSGSRDGIWDWDITANAVFLSAGWKAMLGYQDAELENSYDTWMQLMHPDDLERVMLRVNEYLEGQQPWYEAEYRLRHKDSHYRWVHVRGAGIRDAEGHFIRMAGSLTDISERHHDQAQLEKSLEEKTVLLREIHHRVKNNLQVITSLLALQSNQSHDSTFKQAMLESQDRVKAMALIHELLYETNDFSRINLSDYLERLMGLIRQSYLSELKRIHLKLELAEVYVDLDKAIPCGLLVNELVSNAIKHAFVNREAGEITVSVRVVGQETLLSVSDNGIGFSTSSTVVPVKSLGLRLVTMLATQIGGRVVRENKDGTHVAVYFTSCFGCDGCQDSNELHCRRHT